MMKIERQLQGTLNTVFTELIKERGLEKRIHPYVAQEEGRADVTLKNSNGKPIFFIELKDPTAKDGKSVFDSSVLMRETERAQKLDIKYFGNCNFLACAFIDRDKIYEKVAVNEGFFTIQEITRLSVNYSPNKDVLNKLRTIAGFYLDRALEIIERKPITFSNLDELFIFKIRKLIEVYAHNITDKVWEKYRNNKSFEKDIQRYTQSQLWNKPQTYEEIENLTHIAVLMLISKLIFYKAYVDNQTWSNLSPMKVSANTDTPEELEKLIWKYFETFQEITGNFELLIGERSDIIFQIPFVSDAVIDLVKEVLDTEGHYNFSEIPFDIIGRIFEELIREDERHKLGQYFTPPHVIDLINAFAINKSNDKVFDPSCGSGTFLVRAYERKKLLCAKEDKGAKHEILLNEIYGNDLSGYPAYLSMLNLAIRNTRRPSYPRIVNKDFFSIAENTKVVLHNQQGEKENKPLPKFDAIIGNPPYTRQEDIGAMNGTVKKPQIMGLVNAECGFEPSQRTSIYGYFFYHASAFLKDNGYLAFIVQNSWLETDYGIDMQRYFMRNYQIVAIMDSEVERFFPSASVNTSIVILRKQNNENTRNNNIVKFVYFTAPLLEIIKKHKGSDKLKDIIDCTKTNINNEYFRINCIKQQTLQQYSKWTQFLKAPKIYFDILEKGEFVPLKELADVKFGLKTGCNEFFVVKDVTDKIKNEQLNTLVYNVDRLSTIKQVKQNKLRVVENGFNEFWLIESKFLKPYLKSSRDVNKYEIQESDLVSKIILIENETAKKIRSFDYIFHYIKEGQRKQISDRPTCASRNYWYVMDNQNRPDLSFNRVINDFGRTYKGKLYYADVFNNIHLKSKNESVWLYMNSTFSWLIQQVLIRSNFGDGAGEIKVYELADFPVPNINLKNVSIDLGETKNYKEELGTLESLKTVNPERVKLDTAILEAIGYKNKKKREDVLLELYRATFQLINARLQKAQSLKGVKAQRNKVEFSVYVEQLKSMLVEGNYEAKNTVKFGKSLENLVKEISSNDKLQKKIIDTYWKEKFGAFFNEKEITMKDQTSLF